MPDISLTSEQLKELVRLVTIGHSIMEMSLASEGKDTSELNNLYNLILAQAQANGASEMLQNSENGLELSDDEFNRISDALDAYDNDNFWYQLSLKLAKREYLDTASEDALATLNETGEFPDSIDDLYEKYYKELQDHGLDNIRIEL